MAIDFVCGWECRIATNGAVPDPNERHWDNAPSAVMSISTSTVRTGTAALRCNAVGTGDNLQKTIARTVVAGRVYVRFASFPATTSGFIRLVDANGNGQIQTDTSGNITANIGSGSTTATIATLSTGTWYRIDWLFNSSANPATLKVRIDGGTEQTASTAQVSANATAVLFGNFSSTTMDLFFDDLLLGDATGDYPFGIGTVERMKPTRDGTHSFTALDFEYNDVTPILTSATDVNTYVDDDALTTITDFISQNAQRTTGYVEVGFGAAPFTHDALAVMVVASFHASATGANTFGLKLNDGGTLRNLTDEAGDGLGDYSATSFVQAEKLVLTAPSGGAWTAAKVAAVLIRAGYSGDVVGIPYWDGVMLEVAYAPAGAPAAVPYRNRYAQLLAH